MSHARKLAIGLALTAGALAHATILARAQTPEPFPNRNITWIVGFPPGGPPDLVARNVAPGLQEILGRPVVIENRTGASGAIAATAVARAAPDGHTIGSYDIAVIVAPLIIATPGFDPAKDFRPIVPLAKTPVTLVVHAAMPVKSVKEFVDLARQKPGEIKIAHSGFGAPPHLGAAAFLQATKTDMLLVPYRGSAPAVQDVVAGHVSALFTGPSTAMDLARSSKVTMLGVTGPTRLKSMPDVPTFRESGVTIESFDDGQWFGIMAPAGTPDAIVARINAAANEVIRRPDVIERFAKIEFSTMGGTPQDMTRIGQSQMAFWRETMKTAGVKPE